MRLAISTTMSATIAVVILLVLATADGVERRRPLYRRTSTTTATPAADDSEGSESKYKPNGKDLYTVSDSYPVSGAGGFKPDGDKLTSFSEYSFGSTKLSGGPDGGGLADGGGGVASDEESTFGGFKNHKKGSTLLPTTNANTKERKPTANSPFDFLNGDYAKPKVQSDTTSLGGLGSSSKSKLPSSISSKFSISHPAPSTLGSGSKAAGKLAHLDDSTEYDVYSSLGQSGSATAVGKSKLGKHRQPLTATSYSSSGGFEGKVKKVPFKYEDGGLGALASKTKTKTKLSLDDDTSHFASASSPFPGLGSYESASFGGNRQQQQQQQLGSNSGIGSAAGAHKSSKFNFAEPPPLVKSTLNTLKHFGEGLIGNGNGAGRAPYELESEESGSYPAQGVKFGSYFGKGHFGGNAAGSGSSSNGPAVEESYETSAEPLPKGKFSKPLGLGGLGGKFATDFDVKNIKLTDGGGAFGVGVGAGLGHKLPGKNTPPHHGKHGPTLHHSQPAPVQQLHSHNHNNHHHQQLQQQHAHQQPAHHTAHGTLGTTGAGIAAKGQIESFLNSEHALKDESLVAQLLGDSSPAARPHYHQFLKSQEDEKLEKEALRQQIEYLKAQAAKRPLDLNAGPHRPPIVSNAQKFRPVRRIPSHVRLGVKAPYPLPRIPNYNDRPYSISFKI